MRRLLLLPLAALALSACGGTPEDRVRSDTLDLIHAQHKQDADAVCRHLSKQAQAQLMSAAAIPDCSKAYSVLAVSGSDDTPKADDSVTISRVRIVGEAAEVTVKDRRDREETYLMTKDGRHWVRELDDF